MKVIEETLSGEEGVNKYDPAGGRSEADTVCSGDQ